MAVLIEYTSIVVPVENIIDKCGEGLWEELLPTMGHTRWHDGKLFRDGAMNPYDIDGMLQDWNREGLQLHGGTPENETWKDLCVVDYFTGPTKPCDWLGFDKERHIVWLLPGAPGGIAGPTGRKIDEDPMIMDPRKFRRSTLGE